MINKQLLDPLRESWELAHTEQPPQQQPSQLPTSLKTLDHCLEVGTGFMLRMQHMPRIKLCRHSFQR